jgi:hypothetical protein
LRCEIGLGKNAALERLEVYWPTTDLTQVFTGLAVNQFIEITEGKDQVRVLAQ